MSQALSNNEGWIRKGVHPKKLLLWLALGSMTMLFSAFSSAYLVREAAGNWLEFRLPSIFVLSTVLLLSSSICLELTSRFFASGRSMPYRVSIVLAFVLGIAFIISQIMGWGQLYEMGVDLKINPSSSFVYLITWVHALHVIGGLVVLVVAMYHAFILPFEVTERRKLRLDLTKTYWHFVDLVWIYFLLLFILV